MMQDLPVQLVNGREEDVEMNGVTKVNGHFLPSEGQRYLEDEGRWQAIDAVLDRRGPWTDPEFVGGKEVSSACVVGDAHLLF